MVTIVFITYTISLIAVAICLWVKWEQNEDQYRMDAIERRQQEIQQQIDILTQQVKKLGVKDPFAK